MKTKRCNRPFKGARGSQTRCIATRCGQKEFDRAGAFRNVVFFAPPSRLGLQRPALESSFPQFLPGFALTWSDLIASAWMPRFSTFCCSFWSFRLEASSHFGLKSCILTDLTGSCSRPKNPSKTCAPQELPSEAIKTGVTKLYVAHNTTVDGENRAGMSVCVSHSRVPLIEPQNFENSHTLEERLIRNTTSPSDEDLMLYGLSLTNPRSPISTFNTPQLEA